MQQFQHAVTVKQSPEVWQLLRNGQTLAVIERAWDGRNWFVFLADASGGLIFHGAYRHLVTLKAILRIWARRNPGYAAHFFHTEQQPE